MRSARRGFGWLGWMLVLGLVELGCAVPRPLLPDEVYTTTIIAESVSRSGEPIGVTREIFEGRPSFFVHSTLTDIRPGKTYEYFVEIRDSEGRAVLERAKRKFLATADHHRIWRRVQPDWEQHRSGRWQISAGIGSQVRKTDLYVLPRWVKYEPREKTDPESHRVAIELGVARKGSDDCRQSAVARFDPVAHKGDDVRICVRMDGLEPERSYPLRIRVYDPLGRVALEDELSYFAKSASSAEYRPLHFGFRAEPGVWTTEVDLGSNRVRSTFVVSP